MQCHPQADPLLASTRNVMRFQRRYQGRWQRFDEQALRHLGRDQHEHAVATVLASISIPWDSDLLERFPDRTIKAVTNRYLMTVGATPVPEAFHVDDDYGPVNRPLCFHTALTRTTRRQRVSPPPVSLP